MDLSALKATLAQTPSAPPPVPPTSCAPLHEDRSHPFASVLLECASDDDSSQQPQPLPQPKGRRRALLRVAFSQVVLRGSPSTEGPPYGLAPRDTVLAADARRGLWARLHNGVHPPPRGSGSHHLWALLLHPQHGTLLQPLDAQELHDLPEAPPDSLPSPEAVRDALPHPDAPLRRLVGREAALRCAAELVVVRAEPSLRARQVGYRKRGEAVVADAEVGDWVRVPGEGGKTAGWILRVHPTLGALLESV